MEVQVLIRRYLKTVKDGSPVTMYTERESLDANFITSVERLFSLYDSKNADLLNFIDELVDKAFELCEAVKLKMEDEQ